MAWQLIYTSAMRTLVPGQSGYGAVARSADLREALIQRLEQLSYYQHIGPLGTGATAQSHVVSAYRILDFRGSRYHILTRIHDAGLDFTSRTNHLAHHLIFEPAELAALAPPAVILSQWSGWRNRWDEGPRFLEEADWGADFATLPRGISLPAATWQSVTGDAGSAAALLVRPYATGCNLLCQPGEESTLLNLFAQSLQLLDPDCRHPVKLWEHTFTTFFQAEDSPGDFVWRGCVEGTPGCQALQRSADGSLVPLREVKAPENQLAKLAREGRPQIAVPAKPNPGPAVVSPTSSPTSLRLESRSPAWRKPPASTPASSTPSAASPRTVTFDFTAARFWLPAIILLLVLVGAFVWPGYLNSRPSGTSPNTAPSDKTPVAGGSSMLPDISPPKSSARDKQKSKPGDDSQSPIPAAALDDLKAKIDNTATWIVILDGEATLALPKDSVSDGLLRKHLLAQKPMQLGEIVECRAVEGRIDLSGALATVVELDSNQTRPKQIIAKLPRNSRLVLDCDDWFNANREPPGSSASVKLRWADAPVANAFTLLLRPVSGSPMVDPFRVIILSGKPVPQTVPTRLSKSLLRSDRDGLEVLAPELLARINAIQRTDAKAWWQLRSSTASAANVDLIDSLDFRPQPAHELDFAVMRAQLESRLTQDKKKVEHVQGEADKLRRQVEDDRAVGEILAGHTNELASLSSFAKAKRRDVDCPTYLLYLKAILEPIDQKLAQHLPSPDAKPDDTRKALGDLGAHLSRHPGLEKKLAGIPPNYFLQRWEILSRLPELKMMENNIEKTRKTISLSESSLQLVPGISPPHRA